MSEDDIKIEDNISQPIVKTPTVPVEKKEEEENPQVSIDDVMKELNSIITEAESPAEEKEPVVEAPVEEDPEVIRDKALKTVIECTDLATVQMAKFNGLTIEEAQAKKNGFCEYITQKSRDAFTPETIRAAEVIVNA